MPPPHTTALEKHGAILPRVWGSLQLVSAACNIWVVLDAFRGITPSTPAIVVALLGPVAAGFFAAYTVWWYARRLEEAGGGCDGTPAHAVWWSWILLIFPWFVVMAILAIHIAAILEPDDAEPGANVGASNLRTGVLLHLVGIGTSMAFAIAAAAVPAVGTSMGIWVAYLLPMLLSMIAGVFLMLSGDAGALLADAVSLDEDVPSVASAASTGWSSVPGPTRGADLLMSDGGTASLEAALARAASLHAGQHITDAEYAMLRQQLLRGDR
jgi:hypothetical protein